jgi:hypothetical protein
MTADAASLLAEIRRSGGDVRLVSYNRLKLVAPMPLLAELAKRVRAAKPMLLAALADTGRQAAQEGGDGVSNPSRNAATAQQLKAESSEGQAIPTPAADWRARNREARAHWGTLHPAEEAAGLAWGELLIEWHKRHGQRWPVWQCAGCGAPIGGRPALDLADGNRVHLDRLDCVLSFGERWRREAAAGLHALRLDPPKGVEP